MTIHPARFDRTHLAGATLLLLCATAACARSTAPDQTEATKTPPATMLRLELPPGVQITVDGEPVGTTPLEPLAVQPGSRTVVLQNDCQRHEAVFELPKGGTKTLSLTDAPTLTYATLHLRARNLAGDPLSPRVTLGDRLIGEAVPAGDIAVPTCKLRLTVTHPDLGGYLEDLDLQPGQQLDRDIVLAPGPDMVHLPGGNFTLGPPAYRRDLPTPDWDDQGHMDYLASLPRYAVTLEPFLLDRTEVTAAQFRECAEAGSCNVDPTVMDPSDLLRMSQTSPPAADEKQLCNTLRIREGRRGILQVSPGRENHPANCIASWQAEKYCSWAGKRLPTDAEWEYAARSGQERFDCPWGEEDDASCGEYPKHTLPVCKKPEKNSQHGVCDLTGNVSEWVTEAHVSGRRRQSEPEDECVVPSHTETFRGPFCRPTRHQRADVGFRCARDARTPR